MRMKKDKLKPRRRFIGYNEEWEQHELGNVVQITMGQSPSSMYYTDNPNAHILVQGNADISNGRVKPRVWTTQVTKIADKGDLILSVRAPVGDVGKTDYNVVLGRGVAGIKGNEFIFQLLSKINADNYWRKFSTGSTFESINSNDIKSAQICFPDYKEQELLGDFFSNIDQLVALKQQKLSKLKAIKKAYLYEMFPTEDENIPKRRFSGFTDAWEQCKLSELATMNARIGWQNLRTSEFLDHGDYMLITGTDFNDGAVDYSTVHYVKKERYDQDKKIQVQNGSILITKDGTLGKVAYVQDLSMPATLNAGVFNVRVIDDSLVDAMYLFHYLSAPFLMDYVTRTATGGTIKHLNQNILVNFPVLLPKIEEQKLISKFLDNLSTSLTLQQRKIEKLQELKQAYLNDMFV